ncbi:cytochrome c biogenesis protein CcdA [Pigmentibacter sp. JX0631]|uniref:protein-disulfide reductase DsbD family protein n=1 Tax=Pigmentibacter sp. JX0631 TaxID=2976982 RepID=UPI0024686842|nr:cytochrome c biogenesis protein CcdA [Pigmentibacter sp. JX0631]WGL59223.1 cytochrome c biogenesis protein CcdA [Pigmentibacter sp. JX0631]
MNSAAYAESTYFPEEFKSSQFDQQVKIENVIKFEVIKIDLGQHPAIILSLTTKDDFKIYQDKLKFFLNISQQLPFELKYESDKLPESYHDPFFKTEKKIFKNKTQFIIKSEKHFNINDTLEINVQSCSNSVCLVPAKLQIDLKVGSISTLSKENFSFNSGNSNFSQPRNEVDSQIAKNESVVSDKITLLNDNLAIKIQDAIGKGSWILFPALLLAGLLMNLTPCVYPMIPITLNVMSQFSGINAKRKKGLLPLYYVLGMILTYSLLGVFAALSGSIFGSQLANPIFNLIIAGIMFLLGLSMLGVFNLSSLQSFGNKIPLAQNYPKIAVLTMGSVSGLISAPCTGPVLSTILILIAQNKNPIVGFTYMFFFALGFGLPYIALGYFGQGLTKVPKFPRLVNFIKIFFAALMFALALYYLRIYLQKISYVQDIYLKPKFLTVFILLLSASIFTVFTIKNNLIGFLSKCGLILTTCFLALWVTLYTTNSFYLKRSEINISTKLTNNKLNWLNDYQRAVEIAKTENKPILIDIWADWCTACLEMEETSWQDPKLIEFLHQNFIVVKLDYTNLPDDIQILVNRWQINGLPAIAYFKASSDFDAKPTILLQGYASAGKLMNTAMNLIN